MDKFYVETLGKAYGLMQHLVDRSTFYRRVRGMQSDKVIRTDLEDWRTDVDLGFDVNKIIGKFIAETDEKIENRLMEKRKWELLRKELFGSNGHLDGQKEEKVLEELRVQPRELPRLDSEKKDDIWSEDLVDPELTRKDEWQPENEKWITREKVFELLQCGRDYIYRSVVSRKIRRIKSKELHPEGRGYFLYSLEDVLRVREEKTKFFETGLKMMLRSNKIDEQKKEEIRYEDPVILKPIKKVESKPVGDLYIPINHAARLCKCSAATIRYYVTTGKLRTIPGSGKNGRNYLVLASDVGRLRNSLYLKRQRLVG